MYSNTRRNRRHNATDVSNPTTSSAIGTNDKEFKELATCCICFETYNRGSRMPIVIPCGHTFCKECADKIATERTFFCCNCRTVSLLGFGGLSRNDHLFQLLDTLDLFEAEEASPPQPERTLNRITDEMYKAVSMTTFSDYCRSFLTLISGYLEFRLGARLVRSNPSVIQTVQKAINRVNAALPTLQRNMKRLQDAPTNPSEVVSLERQQAHHAINSMEIPVFLPAMPSTSGSSSGATSSASSSSTNSREAPRRNRRKKKSNPAPIPQRREIDWDITPSHLDF